ncbi:hypothetical protein GBAR_LOCUS25131 [Geodia barretti]|uniref:Uncharacterized protein n=1 Tax=Geodia barretti TaxID=519541 RepID=A0AA35TCG4_GEOBA|nr:hypothetical protein GBAR_LOCUS25131 [Geodia barretti]
MQQPQLDLEVLDPVLRQVLSDHSEKTLAWMRTEHGAWGYLAGQGVAATRQQLGRQLTDPERRMVWSRLWWWLEQLKLRLREPQ